MAEVTTTIDEATAQNEYLLQRIKELEAEYVVILGDHKFKDYLLKVYRKKMKRKKLVIGDLGMLSSIIHTSFYVYYVVICMQCVL